MLIQPQKIKTEFKKIAFGGNFLPTPLTEKRFSVVSRHIYTFLYHKRSVCIGFALFFFVAIGAGCASTHKTTTTKATTYSADEGNKGYLTNTTTVGTSKDQQNNPVTKESETTTTTTETKAAHPGIIGSTIHAIGWVIALPFRLVGGLIRLIF